MTSQSGEGNGQVTLEAFEATNNLSQVGEFGLALPEPLKDEVTKHIQDIHAAVQGLWGREALDAAVTELDTGFGLVTERSDAFQLFAHLIWLQDIGLLPGYPRYTRTIKDRATPVPIREYCSSHPDFDDTVTAEDISKSNCIERNRLYRSKLYSVTKQFWIETTLVRGSTPWAWETYSSADIDPSRHDIQTHDFGHDTYYPGYDESEFSTTAIFDDSATHNVAVNETRSWLTTHPQVDATVVPYREDVERGIIEIEGVAPADPRWPPYWMFDIGVISGETVVIPGNIVEEEPAEEILDQINRSYEIAHAALIVMPSRKAVHQFLAHGAANKWFAQDIAPIADVVEYYERQPSLRHVNKELWSQSPDLQYTVFLSRKQILDGFVEPHDIIPSSLFKSGQ